MHNYLNVIFLPGAAGNFISRCLMLTDQVQMLVDKNNVKDFYSVEEKYEMISFRKVMNKTSADKSWLDFEKSLSNNNYIHHANMHDGTYFIISSHPTKNWLDHMYNVIVGRDDSVTLALVNIDNCHKWVIENALFKYTGTLKENVDEYYKLQSNKDIINISLKSILESEESFFNEILTFGDKINFDYRPAKPQLLSLYKEWKSTWCTKEFADSLNLSENVTIYNTPFGYIT